MVQTSCLLFILNPLAQISLGQGLQHRHYRPREDGPCSTQKVVSLALGRVWGVGDTHGGGVTRGKLLLAFHELRDMRSLLLGNRLKPRQGPSGSLRGLSHTLQGKEFTFLACSDILGRYLALLGDLIFLLLLSQEGLQDISCTLPGDALTLPVRSGIIVRCLALLGPLILLLLLSPEGLSRSTLGRLELLLCCLSAGRLRQLGNHDRTLFSA